MASRAKAGRVVMLEAMRAAIAANTKFLVFITQFSLNQQLEINFLFVPLRGTVWDGHLARPNQAARSAPQV